MRRHVGAVAAWVGSVAAWPVDRVIAVGRWAQPWMLVAIVGLLIYAWVDDAPWPYALTAETVIATVLPDGAMPTRWDVSDAVVCIRSGSRSDLSVDASQPSDSHCPAGRWQTAATPASVERMLSIRADAGSEQADVRVSSRPEGGVILQVRATQGQMSIESPDAAPIALPSQVLIVFPPTDTAQWPRELVLPFSGAIMIGDDARSGQAGILHRGDLTIYTRSDESIGGRGLVDNIALLPGDRVEASLGNEPDGAIAKGFIHAVLSKPTQDAAMQGFRVVAFGQAEDVRIVRFGEQSRAFRPSVWARISRHSMVGTWVAGLLGALGLMAMYREASGGGESPAPPRTRDEE